MNVQYEIQIIAPSMFIWIIVPLHNQINLLSVFECFYMYMGSHTQINAAVFITMCEALDTHTLFVCLSRALQPLNGPHMSQSKSVVYNFSVQIDVNL